jgi:hypothetical protein
MTSIPLKEAGRSGFIRRGRRGVLPAVLLLASFALAVFPVFHWIPDSAGTAMAYIAGTAAFITAAIVIIYFVDSAVSRPAEGEDQI